MTEQPYISLTEVNKMSNRKQFSMYQHGDIILNVQRHCALTGKGKGEE